MPLRLSGRGCGTPFTLCTASRRAAGVSTNYQEGEEHENGWESRRRRRRRGFNKTQTLQKLFAPHRRRRGKKQIQLGNVHPERERERKRKRDRAYLLVAQTHKRIRGFSFPSSPPQRSAHINHFQDSRRGKISGSRGKWSQRWPQEEAGSRALAAAPLSLILVPPPPLSLLLL